MENTQEWMTDLVTDLNACNEKMKAEAKALDDADEDPAKVLVA